MTPATGSATARLNATAASLLGFLHLGERSGYELVQLADLVIGDFWSLTRSQVYRELAALAAAALVEPGTVGSRARQPYRITEAGRKAFAAWLEQPPERESIRYPLLLAMSFGAMLGADRVLELVADHRVDHQTRLEGYLARRGTVGDPFLEATLAFGIHYERAVLAWMDEVPDLLRAARLHGRTGRARS